MQATKNDKQTRLKRPVKISAEAYDLIIDEAHRIGIKERRVVSFGEVVSNMIESKLSSKKRPELK